MYLRKKAQGCRSLFQEPSLTPSGRTLSGQTVEAFWNSIRHCRPLAVGLNCALGATEIRPWIQELSRLADCPAILYPNAGLPNELGEYDDTRKTWPNFCATLQRKVCSTLSVAAVAPPLTISLPLLQQSMALSARSIPRKRDLLSIVRIRTTHPHTRTQFR